MRPAEPEQLDPVLQRAQELVGQSEALAVLPADVAVLHQLPERLQGGSQPESFVGSAVHELQQLDGELDVAQPALTELDLTSGVAGRDVGDDPLAHGLGVGDEVLPLGRRPHQGATMSTKSWPSSRSPALGRALSMAWNSQVFAHFW